MRPCVSVLTSEMDRLTWQELADMHFMYGLADGVALRAQREYAALPARHLPDRRFCMAVHNNLRQSGNLRVSWFLASPELQSFATINKVLLFREQGRTAIATGVCGTRWRTPSSRAWTRTRT